LSGTCESGADPDSNIRQFAAGRAADAPRHREKPHISRIDAGEFPVAAPKITG
jgi:hypothetical protein